MTRVVVGREPYRDERIVNEFPAKRPGSEPPSLPWFARSPDGEVRAVGICRDGSEHNRIALHDVRTGTWLPDTIDRVLHDGWVGGVVWLPDSTASEEIPLPEHFREYLLVQVSHDGRWARSGIEKHRARSRTNVNAVTCIESVKEA